MLIFQVLYPPWFMTGSKYPNLEMDGWNFQPNGGLVTIFGAFWGFPAVHFWVGCKIVGGILLFVVAKV